MCCVLILQIETQEHYLTGGGHAGSQFIVILYMSYLSTSHDLYAGTSAKLGLLFLNRHKRTVRMDSLYSVKKVITS